MMLLQRGDNEKRRYCSWGYRRGDTMKIRDIAEWDIAVEVITEGI